MINMDFSMLYMVALLLIAAGILIVVVSILGLVRKSQRVKEESEERGNSVEGAGVIMIGPIPIIFGTDKNSVKSILVLAVVLTAVVMVWYYLMLR